MNGKNSPWPQKEERLEKGNIRVPQQVMKYKAALFFYREQKDCDL